MQARHRDSRHLVRTVAALAGAVLGTTALSLTLVGQAGADQTGTVRASAQEGFPRGTVHAEGGLTARQAPSTHVLAAFVFDDGAEVGLDCRTRGTQVKGDADWYLVVAEGEAKWISGHYVEVDERPPHCGPAVSVSATATRATTLRQGPSTDDRKLGALGKGDTTEVLCHTESGTPGNTQRWVVTTKAQWIPANALNTSENVAFCQRA